MQIQIQDQTYSVAKFNDTHLLPLLKLLTDGLGDVEQQHKAAVAIKEIIIPSISDEIISINARQKYIIHLEAEELNKLLLQILCCHYEIQLELAEKKGKKESVIHEIKERLEEAREALKVTETHEKLQNILSISVETPEDAEPQTEEAKAAKIVELQEKIKSLQTQE